MLAKFAFKAGDEYAMKLSKLASDYDEIAKKAIYEGAKVVADRIKINIRSLPTDTFRYLKEGEIFKGVPDSQKSDLIESFGITPIDRDREGWNAKMGFDGYGSIPTQKYPLGLPNQLLARSIESGSSVRKKAPFVRPAVNAMKKEAIDRMNHVIEEETKNVMK